MANEGARLMNPWAWGWDALVAIGTLALAAVTVALLIVPPRIQALKERGIRARRARILALLVVEELARARSQLAMIRGVLATTQKPTREEWLTIALNVDETGLSIFKGMIDHLEDCPSEDAEHLASAFASLMLLKESVAPIKARNFHGDDLGQGFRNAIRGLLANAQACVNLATAVAWQLAGRPGLPPMEAAFEITEEELQAASWCRLHREPK